MHDFGLFACTSWAPMADGAPSRFSGYVRICHCRSLILHFFFLTFVTFSTGGAFKNFLKRLSNDSASFGCANLSHRCVTPVCTRFWLAASMLCCVHHSKKRVSVALWH